MKHQNPTSCQNSWSINFRKAWPTAASPSSTGPSQVLKLLKARIERGDKIKDETTGVIYDLYTFRQFVETNFSTYITGQVFNTSIRSQKIYFTLEACPGGYNLLMADSGNEKTYRWISSLSKRFSLVEMIATGIVYVKDNRTDTYQPFISENGKYCKYNKDLGKLTELWSKRGIRNRRFPVFLIHPAQR